MPGLNIEFGRAVDEYLFKECGEKYVGNRNCFTRPQYMKFVVDGEEIIILLPKKENYFKLMAEISKAGYRTFDLS